MTKKCIQALAAKCFNFSLNSSKERLLMFWFFLVASFSIHSVLAQSNYQPTPENLINRVQFQQNRFGLMIHWGIYSTLAGGGERMAAEKIMDLKKISASDYEQVATWFNPSDFSAEAWVLLAKKAGCRYITFAAKHMDGFAMFDSKVSDFDVVDRTPFKRDPVKELADACRKHGLQLFLFYSQLDWHHPDYFPRGRTGLSTGRPESGDWQKYLQYQDSQLEELLTQYGTLGGIWLNGMWDKKKLPGGGNFQLEKTYARIHSLQPGALLANNHHIAPMPGEDFQLFEFNPPDTARPEYKGIISELPYETFSGFTESWGYNMIDKTFKSTREIIHDLTKAAGANSNYLLNVAPLPTGQMPASVQDTLQRVGQWLQINGETIYGTRAGPIKPQPWGVSTQKGKIVYVHVLTTTGASVLLPDYQNSGEIYVYGTRHKVKYTCDKAGTQLYLPVNSAKNLSTILVIQSK